MVGEGVFHGGLDHGEDGRGDEFGGGKRSKVHTLFISYAACSCLVPRRLQVGNVMISGIRGPEIVSKGLD